MPDHPASSTSTETAGRNVCNLISYKLSDTAKGVILELVVRNHPGTMSHITGLFARRAFNLEAIFVVPLPGSDTSRILLHLADEPKLVQVEKQLAKLHDVLSVRHRADLSPEIFSRWMNQIPDASPAPTS
ncbi:MAG: ACT domain-containing protein [Nibricoccus sp.]